MAAGHSQQISMRHSPDVSDAAPASRLFECWQAEAVRLRETHWGPMEDGAANRMAQRSATDLPARIRVRAAWIAAHSGLQRRLLQWAASARWALVILWIGAGLAGATAAATALAQPQRSINLSLVLFALLGLHALTFLLWLASYLPGIGTSTLFSRAWLALTRRLARGPDSALAAQAFLSLLARARAWTSTLGLVSHGAWSAAFLGMLSTLLALLSTRRYTFHWETTLLSPDSFIAFTQAIGSWPRLLGFTPPAPADIAASMTRQPLSDSLQATWSWWLVGCVLAWGLLPRVIAFGACALHVRRRLRAPLIDPGLPGWLELRDRLMPTHDSLGTDGPAPETALPDARPPAPGPAPGAAAILGYELGADLPWPPAGLPSAVLDLGRCDSRGDRERVRTLLAPAAPQLLLVCDARLTPDRGSRAWFGELQGLCAGLQILCLGDAPERMAAWQEMFAALGIAQAQSLPQWLASIGVPRHE